MLIQRLRNYLGKVCLESQTEIDTILAAIVTRNHVFLLGLPGIGKSMVINEICEILDINLFYRLFYKEMKADELYGPIMISKLKDDMYTRQTKGYLPEAECAFLDEIWKGGTGFLNTLLPILNERRFANGYDPTTGKENLIKCPLHSAFSASNELPEDQELEALYDRFLFRVYSTPISDDESFLKICQNESDVDILHEKMELISERITFKMLVDEYEQFVKSNPKILPSEEQTKTIWKFCVKLFAETQIYVSPRRAKQINKAISAISYIHGRKSLNPDFFLDVVNCMWHDQNDIPKIIKTLIDGKFLSSGGQTFANLDAAIDNILSKIDSGAFSNDRDLFRREAGNLSVQIDGLKSTDPEYYQSLARRMNEVYLKSTMEGL